MRRGMYTFTCTAAEYSRKPSTLTQSFTLFPLTIFCYREISSVFLRNCPDIRTLFATTLHITISLTDKRHSAFWRQVIQQHQCVPPLVPPLQCPIMILLIVSGYPSLALDLLQTWTTAHMSSHREQSLRPLCTGI